MSCGTDHRLITAPNWLRLRTIARSAGRLPLVATPPPLRASRLSKRSMNAVRSRCALPIEARARAQTCAEW